MSDKRFVKRKKGQLWCGCAFSDLKKGDVFRLFDEETGTPVGDTDWIAVNNARKNDAGIGEIACARVDS